MVWLFKVIKENSGKIKAILKYFKVILKQIKAGYSIKSRGYGMPPPPPLKRVMLNEEAKTAPPLRGGDRGEGGFMQSPPPDLPPQGGGLLKEGRLGLCKMLQM
jgi:hypothetical protein